MKTLRRKLFGDLRAQSGAFLAVWLTVVLGLAFYGSTYPAGVSLIDSFYATYDQLHYADFNAHFAAASRDEVLDALAGVDGIAAVEARQVIEAGLELPGGERITLRLIGLPEAANGAAGHPAVNDVRVTDGAMPAAAELLLLESFATVHAYAPGTILRVWVADQAHALMVSGLAFAPEYLVAGQGAQQPFPLPSSFGVAYLPDSLLAAMTGQPDIVNDVALITTARADEATVHAALEAALAPFDVDFVQSRVQTASGGVIDANIKGDMAVAAFFSLMFLLVGGLVMAVLLARLMEAETRRIGTMRALGLGRGELVRHYLTYPVLISLGGALVGSVLGYLGSFFVAAYFIQTLAGGSLPTFVNVPQWGFILAGAAVTVLLAVLAGVLPVLRASDTPPGLALRPAAPTGVGAQARLSLRGLPLTLRQAVRNVLRAPARTLNTLIGVTLGCTIIFAASGTADSVVRAQAVQYEAGPHYDLQVTWAVPALATPRRAEIAAVAGVSGVELALAGPVTVRFAGHSLDTYALSQETGTDYTAYTVLAGEPAFSREDAVWIGHNLARVLGVGVGDVLTLEALGQRQAATVAGIVEQAVGSPVLVPAALMRQWTPLGATLVNLGLIRVADPAQIGAVRIALGELAGVVAVDRVADVSRDMWAYMSLWANFSYVFQAFGYLLTLVVMFNTVSINLHARREELAIQRALGASLGEIGRAITWESLGITLLGMLVSLPLAGVALAWLLGHYELDYFGTINTIAPGSYLLALVGIAAAVLLAEGLALRSLRRADLGWLSKSLTMQEQSRSA